MTSKHSDLNDDDVANYLLEHTDFLIRHPKVLSTLALAEEHPNVTSLVARQHKYFQLRIERLEYEVSQILALASEHEHNSHMQMMIIGDLLQCRHTTLWLDIAQNAAQQHYGIHEVTLIEVTEQPLKELWQKFLLEGYFMGRISKDQSSLLGFSQNMESATLIPLHISEQIYILGFGHPQAHFFDIQAKPFFFNLLGLLLQQTWHLLEKEGEQ